MSAIPQFLLRGMIEANLEQSLEMLDAGHPTVAIGHLREAITQIELSQDADSSPSPGGEGRGEDEQQKQITLNV